MYDTLRFWTMSCADFLDEYFESEIVKAHLAGSSIIGTALGPRSPGTAYVLLHHYMGSIDGTVGAWGFARGGMGAITQALAASLQASGGTIRTGAPVEQILVRNGRATGVVLDERRGDSARRSWCPTSTCAAPSSRRWSEGPAAASSSSRCATSRSAAPPASSISRSTACREFPAIPQGSPCTRGDMHVTDTIEMMERAYDDWKEGRWSRAPYIDMLIPTQIDPTMAPDGKHYMSVFVQYCPYQLADGEWNAGDAPGVRQHRDRRDRAPQPELQGPHPARRDPHAAGHRERGRPDRGQHLPGRADLRSAAVQPPDPWLRAVPRAGRGMYMCGSSTHPGGGVMGAPGANAAGAILRDLGRLQ